MKEREAERQTDRQRQRETEAETETERLTDRQRQTDRNRGTERQRHRDGQTDEQGERRCFYMSQIGTNAWETDRDSRRLPPAPNYRQPLDEMKNVSNHSGNKIARGVY